MQVPLQYAYESVLCLSGDDVSLIPLRITFSMIAKFGIAGAFGVVYLYTPEVFPTTLRSLQRYASLGLWKV